MHMCVTSRACIHAQTSLRTLASEMAAREFAATPSKLANIAKQVTYATSAPMLHGATAKSTNAAGRVRVCVRMHAFDLPVRMCPGAYRQARAHLRACTRCLARFTLAACA